MDGVICCTLSHPDTVVRWHRQGFVYYWRWNWVRQFSEGSRSLGIKEVVTAPRTPWQNPCSERLIGNRVADLAVGTVLIMSSF